MRARGQGAKKSARARERRVVNDWRRARKLRGRGEGVPSILSGEKKILGRWSPVLELHEGARGIKQIERSASSRGVWGEETR